MDLLIVEGSAVDIVHVDGIDYITVPNQPNWILGCRKEFYLFF